MIATVWRTLSWAHSILPWPQILKSSQPPLQDHGGAFCPKHEAAEAQPGEKASPTTCQTLPENLVSLGGDQDFVARSLVVLSGLLILLGRERSAYAVVI